MWDSNAPLQLLKTMPKKLSKENLEKIQLVIDADKYKNSLVSGFDLCGMYAPFCRDCKKTSIFPCALAYVKMMQSEGMDLEIDARPVSGQESKKFEKPVKEVAEKQVEAVEKAEEVAELIEQPVQKPTEKVEEIAVQPDIVEETAVTSAVEEEACVTEEQPPQLEIQQKAKRKIRIAVARKKIL